MRKIPENVALAAMVVWEHLLDLHAGDIGDELVMSKHWNNYGAFEMRDGVLQLIAPWVEEIYRKLEEKFGEDDTIQNIGMDAYDYDFVPACCDLIEWKQFSAPTLPPADRAVALLIANAALKAA